MSAKKQIILLLIIVFLIGLVLLFVFLQERASIGTIRFQLHDAVQSEASLFEQDGHHYAFLPSHTDLNSVTISCGNACDIYIDGEHYDSERSCADLKTNTTYMLSLKGSFGFIVAETKLVIMQSAEIPAMMITLTDGSLQEINSNKTVEKSGVMALVTADGSINYTDSFQAMHGRGNSSWSQSKKPYTLVFAEDVSLLGLDKSRKWILVANAMDESHLRNKLVYDTAIASGLRFSVDSAFVDLYVNDAYQGLYLLTEKIEVAENRIAVHNLQDATQSINQYRLDTYEPLSKVQNGVFEKAYNIPNNPPDITGGYLIELELSNRRDAESNLFTTKNGQDVIVQHPAATSEAQMDYISTLVQEMEDHLSMEEASEYIDMSSWARFYLIQEAFANISRTSFYFYKDSDTIDGKIYAGPIWDFDLSIGTVYESENSDPYSTFISSWGWFQTLFQNEEFVKTVQYEYTAHFRQLLLNIIQSDIDSLSTKIRDSYLMNETRWSNEQYLWWVNRYETQAEHAEYLKTYLSNRVAYLDNVLLSVPLPEKVVDQSASLGAPTVQQPVTLENEASNFLHRALRALAGPNRYLYISLAVFAFMCTFVAICVSYDVIQSHKRRRK